MKKTNGVRNMVDDRYDRYAKKVKNLNVGECDEFEEDGKMIKVCKTGEEEIEIEETEIEEEESEDETEED